MRTRTAEIGLRSGRRDVDPALNRLN